jgi:uncharacterized protein (DUF885 family)
MNLRVLLFAAVFLCGSVFAPAQALPVSPAGAAQADLAARTQSLNDIFDEIWQDELSHSPFLASRVGDQRYAMQLPDDSVAAYNDQLAQDAQFVARLAAIDTAGMPEQEILSRDLMLRQLVRAQEASQFKSWEMPVTAFSGLPAALPRLAEQLRFTSAQDYDAYTNLLDRVPATFRQITDNIMIGIEDKRVPPKSTLEQLLEEINALLAMKPEDSPFAAPLREFPAPISGADQAGLREEVLTAITKQVYPAYQRFGKFLQAVYIPAGRAEDGMWALPDGDAYYIYLVKQETTTDLTAAQIHQLGESWVARDEDAELALAKKLGYPTQAALRTAMAADPHLCPTSAAQLLDAYRSDVERMSAKLPELFRSAPEMTLTVEAMPAWMEPNHGAAYFNAGAQGGTLYVNTGDLPHRSLADVESIVYNLAAPGEGFETWMQREQANLPGFRRWMNVPAFREGWGLYAEQLGQDAGLYQDPYAEVARLEHDEQVSIALVVDTGIHAEHWTRQQAVDYYHAHSGLSDTAIGMAVDRIIAEPGKALSAKTGELEILGLRAAAQKTLGARFDLRAFDQEVIGSGALPLDMLSDRVAAWMNGQQPPKQ